MTYKFVLTLVDGMVSGKSQVRLVYQGEKLLRIPSKRFKDWRTTMAAQLKQQHQGATFPLQGPLALTVEYWPDDPYRRDATGMADAVFHLLEHCEIVKNDNQFKSLHWIERERMSTGRLELTVEERDLVRPSDRPPPLSDARRGGLEMDTSNKFFVSMHPASGKATILNLPLLAQGVSKDDAMTLCAWLLAVHTVEREEFQKVWDAVEGT